MEERTDTAGCTRLRRPMAVSLAEAKDMATVVVDTVGTLRGATEAAWGWVIPHTELLGSGSGLGRLLFSMTSSDIYDGRLHNSSAGGGYDDLLLGRGTGGAGGFDGCDGMDRFGGAVWGLGMGMSNGGAAPGGALGVGGFEFDDVSLQFPAASYILCGDSFYTLRSAGHGNSTIGRGASGGPGPRSQRGGLFGC
jgi:hypothetical protein